MARLVPDIQIDEIENKPERDVARALIEQLPNQVTVYHSYPWLRPDRNDRTGKVTLREGEADFLVLWPELGLLVLEVKGGEIGCEPDRRRWYRHLPNGGERDIKDPFEQANRNMHVIVDAIGERAYGGGSPDFAYGYAVVFPDCRYEGSPPPGAQPAILLSSDDLPRMVDRISRALRQWSRRDPPEQISKEKLREVKQAILPRFNLVPVLGRTIEEQEERLLRLTDDQIRLLEFLGSHRRVAIEGVAGSGKTLMAKAQAQRFAEQGKRTLFLCYNKALAEWLRDTASEESLGSIHVTHFHRLCADVCKKAGMAFRPPDGKVTEFWKHEAPELLWDALEVLPDERYDAIVVDEGQDFHPDWWDPIQAIESDEVNGFLYVFYDPAQNLYNESGVSIPSLGEPYRLPTNCRNTQAIAQTCAEIIGRPIETKPGAPMGVRTEVVEVENSDEVIRHLNDRIEEWIGRQAVHPSQMVVLSPFRRSKSSLSERSHLSGISIIEDLDSWKEDRGILYSTIRSFKGLEADIVVMIDVVEPGTISTFSRSDLYVGCSRAKHLLEILTTVPPSHLFERGGAIDE